MSCELKGQVQKLQLPSCTDGEGAPLKFPHQLHRAILTSSGCWEGVSHFLPGKTKHRAINMSDEEKGAPNGFLDSFLAMTLIDLNLNASE